MTNEERIELCLKRLSMGKTSDVVNFSYADALEYIERLKEENAELRKLLKNERHEAKKRKMALAERRAHDAEHRAARAEMALLYACKSILKDRNDTERRVRAYFNAYLERAEKELAEEGKDE